MVSDPTAVARDAHNQCMKVMERDGAEAVVLGCTIVAACYEKAQMDGSLDLAPAPIINPNVMAVKVAELLADLRSVGQYRISRRGYYQQHAAHDPIEAQQVLDMLMSRNEVTQ
jgi:Asp/Glu/hydantoin racemase